MNEQKTDKTDKGPKRPKKKRWKKELQKKLLLTLAPPLVKAYLVWYDRAARANDQRNLTLINIEEMRERIASHQKPSILAMWHNRLLFGPTGLVFLKGKGAVVMVSRSFDGQLIAETLKRFEGIYAARGSSSKDGRDKGGREAFGEMLEFAEKGYDLIITPDGPQGPMYKAKQGIAELAKITGFPIFTVGCNSSRFLEFKQSWDNTRVPLVHAKVMYTIGDPIYVPSDADDDVLEAKRKEVEDKLIELTEFADHFFD
jgi:lysophospholipid acyltransferase (LPLAT)-like uncharacterized protein